MNIKPFLKKHNYIIEANLRDDLVEVTTPKKIINIKINPMFVTYRLVDDGVKIKVEDLSIEDSYEHEVNFPPYTGRPYIINHIIKNCLILDYPFGLIEWEKMGRKIEAHNFYLSIKSPPEESLEQETALCAIATYGATRGFGEALEEEAKISNVMDGYKEIKKLFNIEI